MNTPRCATAIATVTIGFAAAGCTASTAAPTGDDVPVAVTDASATTVATTHSDRTGDASADIVDGVDAGPVTGSPPRVASTADDTPVVVVDAGDGVLPAEVVAAYRSQRGDLVAPDEWVGRFGWPTGFVRLTGSGVRLVEVSQTWEATGDGAWSRVDEASWLLVDDRSRDDVLAEIASAVNVTNDVTGGARTGSVVDGAECVVDTYPPTGAATVWTLQGCTYPRYAGMLALGATRSSTTSVAPGALDTSVTVVADELGGTAEFVQVRLGPPGADDATLHTSTQLRFVERVDVDTAVGALVAGVLAGWQILRGDDSVLLSGPTGARWTITDTVAVFDWAGRW